MGCNYLSLPKILGSGNNILKCSVPTLYHVPTHINFKVIIFCERLVLGKWRTARNLLGKCVAVNITAVHGECGIGLFSCREGFMCWGQLFKSLAPGRFEVISKSNFHTLFIDWYIQHVLWSWSYVHSTEAHWWYVNIGSGNGLMPTGHKPLPESMLT